MRNYIQTFWCVVHAKFDDGVNPPIEFDFKPFGGTMAELAASREALITLTIGSDPPAMWTFTNRLDPFPAWFLFDKTNVVKMMNVIRDFFFDQCLMNPFLNYEPIPPENQLLRAQLEQSPRSTGWTDSAGVKRKPTPSDKGTVDVSSSRIFDVLTTDDFGIPAALLTLEQSLRREGFDKEANFVEYALDRINDLTFTIFEAIEYLQRNGIL